MMAEKRQTYTAEFKREAVRLVTVHGYGAAEAARNLGINATMLGRWKREQEAREDRAFPGKGRLLPEHEELHRLREENKRLRLEREILKKSGSLRCQRVELRYAFMAQHQAQWPVSVMCEVMQVSRSGFYAYVQRQASTDGGAEEAALLTRVQAIAVETRHT
jgi:transposase-like protein